MGFSVRGRPIRCRVYGRHGPAVLVVGGIHGDEPASATLARVLCDHLDRHPAAVRGRRVIVAPAVNPDGLARGQRANARGVDLNRNFDTPNWRRDPRHGARPMSEPETRFIARLIRRYDPAVVVQIHQPLACIDWDGPASDLAEAMAEACGLPTRKLGARPGSLGSYAGVERRVPTLTLELAKAATGRAPEQLWSRYGPALLAAVEHPEPAARAEGTPKVEVHGEVRLRWEHVSE